MRLVLDVEDSPENADFFVNYKRTLKARFRHNSLLFSAHSAFSARKEAAFCRDRGSALDIVKSMYLGQHHRRGTKRRYP